MDVAAARRIIECLADGLDPISGESFPAGSPLQNPDVVRALHVALSALDARIERRPRETEGPSNAGRAWIAEEDRALAEAFDTGTETLAEIAGRFGRTEDAIAARLVRIGKVPDRQTARNFLRRR